MNDKSNKTEVVDSKEPAILVDAIDRLHSLIYTTEDMLYEIKGGVERLGGSQMDKASENIERAEPNPNNFKEKLFYLISRADDNLILSKNISKTLKSLI